MSFRRYEKYKKSGAEWLGEVPEHWAQLPGRRIFSQKREPSNANDEHLSATQRYGVIPQSHFMKKEDQKVVLALSGLENFKHVEKGDFVISLRSFQGGIERSLYQGCVSPAYTVLRSNFPSHTGYWAFLLKSEQYIAALQTVTDGIREGKNISYEQFGRIILPLPPPEEQTSIASFLDCETAKIDILIAEQQRLIELLKEKRLAVISHAVTKGLSPDVPMRDSGEEWLGDVPEHWDLKRLKYTCNIFPSNIDKKSCDLETAVFLCNYTDVYYNDLITKKIDFMRATASEDQIAKFELKAGDVIITKDSETTDDIAIAAYVLNDLPGVVCGYHLSMIRPCHGNNGLYIKRLFDSHYLKSCAAVLANGLTRVGLSQSALDNLVIPLPPQNEQYAIAAYLNQETTKLDGLSAQARQAIALLQERRIALISVAVTGKIDVRNTAKQEAL